MSTERVKQHFKDHKEAYVAGGICLLLGAATGTIWSIRRPEVQAVQKIIGPSWRPTQTIIQFVERSTPSKHLHKVGTHEYYDSVSDCARKTGLDRTLLSKHINGYIPDVKGDIFEVVQPAA